MSKRLSALVTSALLVGGLFVGAPAPAYAADPAVTYYVAQSGTPDGDGSSCTDPDFVGGDRTPIAAAAFAATNGDTIYICAGTYAIETQVVLGGGLTLQGAGDGVTILDGGNTFNEDGSSNNDGDRILDGSGAITLSDITFQNAFNGAISAADVALAVFSSSFLNNTTNHYGGAIYNGDSGMVTIIDSTFTNNTATDSGGAVWTATAVVSDSTFTNNDAADDGGAIGTDFGNVTATNSTFTGNTADDKGGAIYTLNTGVTVTNSTFTDNSAEDDGGAIRAYTVTATNSTFAGNTSVNDDGGAIHADNDATVTRSIFTGNTANEGGAIDATTATVTNSTFTKNTVTVYGGAIYANTATVSSSRFTDNKADVEGGAILAGPGTIITRSRFTRNTAGEHGGAMLLYAPNSADLQQLRGNTFMRNSAPAGGAITLGPCVVPSRSQAASVERANRFSGNRATEQRRTQNIERWDDGGCG